MNYRSIISKPNLELAWRRMTTGRNLQHKRFNRHLYICYEAGLRANLGDLHDRLRGGWKASCPTRVFIPKPSGLLRPLTLLSLEDQIVLQAFANEVAGHVFGRRKQVELKQVFSNCLNDEINSIFFFKNWQETYNLFKIQVEGYINSGYQWIAHFDLAAFYETISHRALKSIIAPRNASHEMWARIGEWLCTWSTSEDGVRVDHGIPQGPLASDFLAETFLLPVDEQMKKRGIHYLRYVDDIRVFGQSEYEARQAAVILEMECRRWSLIPQSSKFTVTRAESLLDALGTLPSMTASTGRDSDEPLLKQNEAQQHLQKAVVGRPLRVCDKTRLRYVLYRAEPSRKILLKVLALLPSHPEHIDAFVAYIDNYRRSKAIARKVKTVLENRPLYDYVEGEMWRLIAQHGDLDDLKQLLPLARKTGKRWKLLSLPMKVGLMKFFLKCNQENLCKTLNRLQGCSSLLLSFLIGSFSEAEFGSESLIRSILRDKSFEAGITLGPELLRRRLTHSSFGMVDDELCPQIRNVFVGLGFIKSQNRDQVDQIGEILEARFKLKRWRKWRQVLNDEYSHAMQILMHADANYNSARSEWMQLQNSFNDVLFRSLQLVLTRFGLPGSVSTRNKHGELIQFGVLLDPNKLFAQIYSSIASGFREMNERRNRLPGSHPYEKNSGTRTVPLSGREQAKYRLKLTNSYSEIVKLLAPHL